MMPKRTRMKIALVLATGAVIVTSTGAPATNVGKRPPNGWGTVNSGKL